MADKKFQDIVRKFGLTVKLDETAPPTLWAAKLQEELAVQQRNLQASNPQNLSYFALEKQCLELEEAIQFLTEEGRRGSHPELVEKARQIEEELAAKQLKLQESQSQNLLYFALEKQCLELDAELQKLNREKRDDSRPEQFEKLRQIEDQLAAKRRALRETNPQNLSYFALEKQCLELEEAVRISNREIRRASQRQLFQWMRQAVEEGDKLLYDALIMGQTPSLLPLDNEQEFRTLLEIKRLAALKRWPRDPKLPASVMANVEPLLAPPTSPRPFVAPVRPIPAAHPIAQPVTSSAARPETTLPAEAPLEAPPGSPVTTTQPPPKRGILANPWVWVLPTAAVAVAALVFYLQPPDHGAKVQVHPDSGTPDHSQEAGYPRASGPVGVQELLELFDHAINADNPDDRNRAYRVFMQKSGVFAVEHPDQTNLWAKRAEAAMELDYAHAGWTAGRHLTSLGMDQSQDPYMQKIMANLENKGWLASKRPGHDWNRWTIDEARKAAQDGDEEAEVALGDCYFLGLSGLKQDFAEAIEWFRKAAEQSDYEAEDKLGLIYLSGSGVDKDYTQALSWFRKAAAQEDFEAQDKIGLIYLSGFGVEKNYAEALSWFRKAAAQNDFESQNNLGLMYLSGSGVRRDYAEALAWFRKAAAQGSLEAEDNLGVMYLSGNGVQKDEAAALEWFRKAAAQGDHKGQNSLGLMYLNGLGVSKDYAVALSWFRKAAEQHDGPAYANLGIMYLNGYGVDKNYTEALQWFREGSDRHNSTACRYLGLMYENGLGVATNVSQALDFYRQSVALGNSNAVPLLEKLAKASQNGAR